MTAVFALVTSLMWGLADFGGGWLTRRIPAPVVLLLSQFLAACALGTAVLVTHGWEQAGPWLKYAVAAGVAGPVGQFAFYQALALGPIGVVSPLTALGAVAVPVTLSLFLGEQPGSSQLMGMVAAVAGVVLATGPAAGLAPLRRRTLFLTSVAAAGIGAVLALIAMAAAQTLTGLLLGLFVQRACNAVLWTGAVCVAAARGRPVLPVGGRRVIRAWLPVLALVGLVDVAANATYSLAAHQGPIAVAAVLSSLYPAVTALAARGLLREKLLRVQALGVGLALLGTMLLATM